jgi:threonine synthase
MTAFHLECGGCGSVMQAVAGATVCGDCGRPLLVRYSLGDMDAVSVTAAWSRRRPGMWRFRELLPLRDGEEPITIGEGDTPLLSLDRLGTELGGVRLLVKDEGRNPTGSFKDRGLSAAVTRAVHDGARALVIPSAGNAGAALAAYAARAGVHARVYVPEDTPAGVERRCRAYGAELIGVRGLISDCGRLADEYATASGAFDLSTLKEPYRIEGKKTMMLEVARALGWQAPDAIVYPTGGGTGLIASWKVIRELAKLGIVEGRTRCYAVQADGCAPIVRAWKGELDEAPEWKEPETRAWGLRVPRARGDFLILSALRESGGGAVAVSDADMEAGADDLARREGVNASIEGGATLAAARSLASTGEIRAGETVVLFNTGHMLTY